MERTRGRWREGAEDAAGMETWCGSQKAAFLCTEMKG